MRSKIAWFDTTPNGRIVSRLSKDSTYFPMGTRRISFGLIGFVSSHDARKWLISW